MNKFILCFTTLLLLSGCSDILEDEDYIHIKKDQVICKKVKEELITYHGRNSHSEELQTKERCLFFRIRSESYNSKVVANRRNLEEELMSYDK